MRIDRVYTRGGDQGQTSLIGGERVSKASPRLDGYGTVDELNATLGLVGEALAASAAGAHLLPVIRRVQNELFNLGAELATADAATRAKLPRIEQRHIDALEGDIDAVNDDLRRSGRSSCPAAAGPRRTFTSRAPCAGAASAWSSRSPPPRTSASWRCAT